MARLLFHRARGARGQVLIEFAFTMPVVLLIALGVIEFGNLLLDQQVVTKITREGSNLISRDTTLQDAAVAMRNMNTRPVDFSGTSKLIMSVLKRGGTSGTPNYDQLILYQRYEIGGGPETSKLSTRGTVTFGGPPDYVAPASDSNTNLQVTDAPPGLLTTPGGMVYVTEVYSDHKLLTPLGNLGITLPTRLYSIAYF